MIRLNNKNVLFLTFCITAATLIGILFSGCTSSNGNHENQAEFLFYPSKPVSSNLDLRYVAIVNKESAYINIGGEEIEKKIVDVDVDTTTIMFKFEDKTGMAVDLKLKLLIYIPHIPCSNLSEAEVFSLDIYKSKI